MLRGQRESLFKIWSTPAWLGNRRESREKNGVTNTPHPLHPKGLVGGRVDEIDFSLSFDSPMCGIAVMFK
jgi:hypothetical protein